MPLRMPRQGCGLVLEQPAFAVEASAIAAKAASGGDHPVARDDDRDRVLAIGGSDCPAGAGLADTPGQLGIRDGRAVRDFAQLMPDSPLKRCSRQIECEVKAGRDAIEISLELAADLAENGIILDPPDSRPRLGGFFEPGHGQPGQSFAAGCQKQGADRAGDVTVIDGPVHRWVTPQGIQDRSTRAWLRTIARDATQAQLAPGLAMSLRPKPEAAPNRRPERRRASGGHAWRCN